MSMAPPALDGQRRLVPGASPMRRMRRRRIVRRAAWSAAALLGLAAAGAAWIGRSSPLALVSGLWSAL